MDFITNNAYRDLIGPIAAIYIASLAIYTGDKEFERWSHNYEKRRPGEIFVIVWTVLIVLIFIFDLILAMSYKMPDAVISTYIAVLTVLAITGKSKWTYNLNKSR